MNSFCTSLLIGIFIVFDALPLDRSCNPHAQAKKPGRTGAEGNTVVPSATGFTLLNSKYTVEFKPDRVEFKPVSGAPHWSWRSPFNALAPYECGNKIAYDRNGITEEYIIGKNSIEQRFVIYDCVPGENFRIHGSITSSGKFSKVMGGWQWKNRVGKVTLSDIYVFDATGRTLPACMDVTPEGNVIEIEAGHLETAVFPVTIDPEIGTNDFRISQMGADGDINFNGLNAAVSYNTTANRHLVVWEGTIAGKIEVWGQLLDGLSNQQVGDAFQISNTPGDANFDAILPDVASSGNSFLVAWSADRDEGTLVDNEFEIYAQVVETDGDIVFSDDYRISTMGSDGDGLGATAPSVVYNATENEFLVAWAGDNNVTSGNEIYVQRLDNTGSETGTDDIRISTMGTDPSTSFNANAPDVDWNSDDNQYIVVWHADDATDNEFEIYGQRLAGSNAAPIGSDDFRISTMGTNGVTSSAAFNPSIAYNPSSANFLVAWNGDPATGGLVDNENEIFGQFLNNLGVETGSNDFRISDMGPDGNANYDAFSPAVTIDPNFDRFLVTWHGDDDTAPLIDNEVEIFGQMISGAGSETGVNDFRVSDAGGSGNTTSNAADAGVAYNELAREFLVVWEADDTDVTGMVDNEFEIFGQLLAELDAEPTGQPTVPIFTLVMSSSLTLTFTPPLGTPDGYIALRSAGAAPADAPADHEVYSIGETIGTSTVAHVGSEMSFDDSGLMPATHYY